MAAPIKTNNNLTRVRLALLEDEKIDCFLFTSGGENAIQRVLNDDRKFIPVQIEGSLSFVSKSAIKTVKPY